MSNPRFIVRLDFSGLRAEVWVNEIPVGIVVPGDASPVAIPVNQFLTFGRNSVGVMLHAGPVPSRAGDPWPSHPSAVSYTGAAKLNLRIAQYAPDQTALADDPPSAATIDWQGPAVPQPSYLQRELDVPTRLGPWIWESATRFANVDSRLRSRVLEYLSYLHGLLNERRFDAFVDESAIKFNDLTERAYGLPPEPMRRQMLEALNSQSSPPNVLEPLNPNDLDLRLVAGGRMIECLRSDRRYVLEYQAPGQDDEFFLPTMIGETAGRWRILR
jgi:hypothetical protein